ncbi:hypothetical protein B0H13DRAFT_2455741 [Mycena leptocephala]|nr:hypothetical protein B0H13DRAFT_2455741 [Mycena leptocephala]
MHRHSPLFVSSRTLCFFNGVSLSRDSGNTTCAGSSTKLPLCAPPRPALRSATPSSWTSLSPNYPLGISLLQIPLQYIVQGHRYNIFEVIGCLGETYETPLAVVLFHLLPPIPTGAVSTI